MIYLRRVSTDNRGNVIADIEALEDNDRLELFLSRGYECITRVEYRTAWQEKDKRAILQPVAQQPQPQRERTAGDPYPLPGGKLPDGYKVFFNKKEG